jgi:hypothetical protein
MQKKSLKAPADETGQSRMSWHLKSKSERKTAESEKSERSDGSTG